MKKMMKSLLTATILTVMVLAMGVMVSAAQTPGKVTGLKQTDSYKTSVDIQWDAQLMDCMYDVEMSEDGQNWVNLGSTYSSSDYIYNLTAGKTYYVRIRANSGTSTKPVYGPYSDTLAVVTAPLEVKDIYQSGASTDSITLSWTKAEGATSYQIYEYINGTNVLKGETSVPSYTISGLKNTEELAFSSIVVKPVRNSGTYKAVGSSTYLYSSAMRLVPAKVTNVNVKYFWSSLKEVNIGFDDGVYADGYQYQLYNLNGKKPVSTSVTSSAYSTTIKNVKEYRFYKVRVRAYATVNGKNVYGAWSDFKGFAFQPKVNIKASGKRNFRLSWKKVKGAKSYTVYMSTSQKSGYKKIKTLKKASYTVTKFKKKKLKKRKTYYFYVVANAKMGKKNVKSHAELCYYATRY